MSSVPFYNSGFELWASTVDDSDHILLTGFTGSRSGPGFYDYEVYGDDTVYDVGSYQQQVVIKADSNGHFIWAKGSQQADASPYSMVTDKNGNVYVFGSFINDTVCSFDTFHLHNPMLSNMFYLVKYSPGGKVVWAKKVAGTTRYFPVGYLGIDETNNLYLSSSFDNPSITIDSFVLLNANSSGGTFDIFIAKYDTAGNPVWAKRFGGEQDDIPSALTVTEAGKLYISAAFSSSVTVGTTLLTDSSIGLNGLIKLDNNGDAIWAKVQSNKYMGVIAIAHDLDEDIYMTGYIDSGANFDTLTLFNSSVRNVFVAKYDSSGTLLWATDAGGNCGGMGYSIDIDNCRNVWIAGAVGNCSGAWLYFNKDSLMVPSGADPAFIAKFSSSGYCRSAIILPAGGDDLAFILDDKKGHFYFAGDFFSLPIEFGTDTLAAPVYGIEELFLARFDTSCLTCTEIPVPGFSNIIKNDTVNFTYTGTSGIDSLTWTFGDGSTSADTSPVHIYTVAGVYTVCVTIYTSCAKNGSNDTFCKDVVIRLDSTASGSGISNISLLKDVQIFPNPATGTISICATENIIDIAITNLMDQTVYKQACKARQVQVDVSDLSPGMYFIKINGTVIEKIMKQ